MRIIKRKIFCAYLIFAWFTVEKNYLDDCRITRNTFLYLSQVPVNHVSGRIGTILTFFIPNDYPSKMVYIHQFEWNASHSSLIGNSRVNIQNNSSFVESHCSSCQDQKPNRRSTSFQVCELELSGVFTIN